MCGIAGLMLFDGCSPERALIEGMVERLSHRGPDGEGLEVRDWVALGHRRLSIVDVEGGRQPLFNEDGQVGVVFNGEIYNQLDLRRRLEARGHRFASRCDTEVLVHGWEEWGAGLVEELRGMFAFAIGFEGDPRSELDYAAHVARTLGTENHEEVLRPNAAEILPDLVPHDGEPFGDNSAVPTNYVSRLARRHVPIVLSDDGGGEAFDRYSKCRSWLKPSDPRRRRPTDGELLQINQHLSADWRRRLLRPELQEEYERDGSHSSALWSPYFLECWLDHHAVVGSGQGRAA